jgi:hypothetical protein
MAFDTMKFARFDYDRQIGFRVAAHFARREKQALFELSVSGLSGRTDMR